MRRILYKISGEALSGEKSIYDTSFLIKLCQDIKALHSLGVQICITVGGGNIFRGVNSDNLKIKRTTGDGIGMLSTVINAIVLRDYLMNYEIEARVLSAIEIQGVCSIFKNRDAIKLLDSGNVLIFAAGIGQPYFTTDTCAVIRALQVGCDAILKGTSVDGVYSDDPKKNPNAKRYEKISYNEVIKQDLKIMDHSAILIARDNNIPIYVFSIKDKQNPLTRIINKTIPFTIISNE